MTKLEILSMEDFDISKATGELMTVINLLHVSLEEVVAQRRPSPTTITKRDFSQIIRHILKKKVLFSNIYSEELKKIGLRAIEIRNKVCHQDFKELDEDLYVHSMECFIKLASLIQKPETEQKIRVLYCLPELRGGSNCNENENTSEADLLQWKNEAATFYKEDRWTEAMNCYTRSIKKYPKEATLFSNRALCELKLKKYELARQDAEDAHDLDSNCIKYYQVLSEALVGLKLYKEALCVCESGLKIDSRDDFLLIQERNCKSFITTEEIDAGNPRPHLNTAYEEMFSEISKNFKNRMKIMRKLTPKPGDVKELMTHVEFMKEMQMTKYLGGANEYILGSKKVTKSDEKALAMFETAAKTGNAEGLYNLARFYKYGKGGLTKDFVKAGELFHKAATQKAFLKFNDFVFVNIGVADAENAIGNRFRDGSGEDVNLEKAFTWHLRAAEHGLPEGQNNVGVNLLNGFGCKQDYSAARKWFELAAEQKIAEAQLNLADMLKNGWGGAADFQRATELYKCAADQGSCEALFKLQEVMRSGVLGASASLQSFSQLNKKAEIGDPNAFVLLGYNHYHGTGGAEKNFYLAKKFWEKAVELGQKDALMPLASLLLELKFNNEAFVYLLKAAENEAPGAACLLSQLYATGHGCTRNEFESRRWFQTAKRLEKKCVTEEEHKPLTEEFLKTELKTGQEMVEFEKKMGFNNEDVSLNERHFRYLRSKSCRTDVPDKMLVTLEKLLSHQKPLPDKSALKTGFHWIEELAKFANRGSESALNFIQAMEKMSDAGDLIRHGEYDKGFKLFRLSHRLWDQLIYDKTLFTNTAKKVLDKNSSNAEALFVYALSSAKANVHETLTRLQRCIELDPLIPDYHQLCGCFYGFTDNFAAALREIDRALELEFCPGWLYDRATALRLKYKPKEIPNEELRINTDKLEIIQAYKTFLEFNPADHRKVPEAYYYSIGYIYGLSNEFEKAKEFWKKGQMAEDPGLRLPCLNPVGDFPPKDFLNMIMSLPTEQLNATVNCSTSNNVNDVKVDKFVVCNGCLNSNPKYRCGGCQKVWYCSKECQKNNWKQHKKTCNQK